MSDDQTQQQQQPPPGWPQGWPMPPPGWNATQPVDPWAMLAMRAFPSNLSQLMAAGLPPSVIMLIGLVMLYGQIQTVTKNIDDIKASVATMQLTVGTMSASVWTRADQAAYDAKIDARLRALETRGER